MLDRCLSLALLSLAACSSLPEASNPTLQAPASAPGPQEPPSDLFELLAGLAAREQVNLTFDEGTRAYLAAMPVTRVGEDELNLLLIGPLDGAVQRPAPGFEVVVLEHADAGELARLLGPFVSDAADAELDRAQVMADPRTNSLLVMAGPRRMVELKELIGRLDVEVVGG